MVRELAAKVACDTLAIVEQLQSLRVAPQDALLNHIHLCAGHKQCTESPASKAKGNIVSVLCPYLLKMLPLYWQQLDSNGYLVIITLGKQSMRSLYHSCIEADLQLYGAALQRVQSFLDIHTICTLAAEFKYNIIASSSESITLNYGDIYELLHDLKRLNLAFNINKHAGKTSRKYWQLVEKRMRDQSDKQLSNHFEVISIIAKPVN